jgi:hypothetical protein
MKFVKMEVLIDKGAFSKSQTWKDLERHIYESIKAVVWPPESDKFTIYPQSGKKRGEGNGVKPIKEAFMAKLTRYGWQLEVGLNIATVAKPGKIDAVYPIGEGALFAEDRFFAIEWETGNISSSHRAVNKMSIGLLEEKLAGGILVLPTRKMYNFLTDRVGNFRELAPYFPMWKALNVNEGFLAIIAVEHDAESWDVPRIEKGTDGRAMV